MPVPSSSRNILMLRRSITAGDLWSLCACGAQSGGYYLKLRSWPLFCGMHGGDHRAAILISALQDDARLDRGNCYTTPIGHLELRKPASDLAAVANALLFRSAQTQNSWQGNALQRQCTSLQQYRSQHKRTASNFIGQTFAQELRKR